MAKKTQPDYGEYERELLRQIGAQEFRPVYLVCGDQDYLRSQNVKRLQKAILGDGDAMNSTVLSGPQVRAAEVIEMAETLPFFAERRVITLTDTDFLKKAGEEPEKLCGFIPKMPETTHLIFEETSPNGTYKLYKAIAKCGYVMRCDTPGERYLRQWTARLFQEQSLRIETGTLEMFLQYTGTDMLNILSEMEKLSAYCFGREAVTAQDIRDVCSPVIRDQIFEMIRAIAEGRRSQALLIYMDLVRLQTPPQVILSLLSRQYNQLLQIGELLPKVGEKETAARLKLNPWVLSNRLRPVLSGYNARMLEQCLEACMQADMDYKSGKISPELATENLIILCSGVKGSRAK